MDLGFFICEDIALSRSFLMLGHHDSSLWGNIEDKCENEMIEVS